MVPVTYPKCNNLRLPSGVYIPGCSRFPVNEFLRAGGMVLNAKGWIKLCVKVANRDPSKLSSIFDACIKLDPTAAL